MGIAKDSPTKSVLAHRKRRDAAKSGVPVVPRAPRATKKGLSRLESLRKELSKGRSQSESLADIPPGYVQPPAGERPCCMKCAKEYWAFPELQCIMHVTRCTNCGNKHKSCVQLNATELLAIRPLQALADLVNLDPSEENTVALFEEQLRVRDTFEEADLAEAAHRKAFIDNPAYEMAQVLQEVGANMVTAMQAMTAAIVASNISHNASVEDNENNDQVSSEGHEDKEAEGAHAGSAIVVEEDALDDVSEGSEDSSDLEVEDEDMDVE